MIMVPETGVCWVLHYFLLLFIRNTSCWFILSDSSPQPPPRPPPPAPRNLASTLIKNQNTGDKKSNHSNTLSLRSFPPPPLLPAPPPTLSLSLSLTHTKESEWEWGVDGEILFLSLSLGREEGRGRRVRVREGGLNHVKNDTN